jgi:hypothetical protein
LKRTPAPVNQRAVFLNVPYDKDYEPVFLALIAGILAVGRVPHCVLELPDHGDGRLVRLLEIIETCRTSFHDLSREGTPARHNMPFEFGLSYARRAYLGEHDCFVLERRANRTLKTLSDARIFDVHPHRGRPTTAIACVLDALGRESGSPNPATVRQFRLRLVALAAAVKRRHHRTSIFHRAAYIEFRNAAVELAKATGFMR